MLQLIRANQPAAKRIPSNFEKSQKGNLDITDWILWFLKVFIKAIEKSKATIQKVKLTNNFWKNQVATELNARQKKVL